MNRSLRRFTESRRCKTMLFLGLWNVGARLQPAAVVDAWYASDCDPDLSIRSRVGTLTWMRWGVARFLRGC
jgi:hypothetical protein